MKVRKQIEKLNIWDLFFLIIIALLCLIFCYINLFRYKLGLNSDVASEALLAREIWETKQWIPDSWYASTETRVISPATWSSLLYGLTNNMSLSMGLGCILGMFFFLAAAYYLVKEIKFSITQKLLFLTLCLLLPNNMDEIQMIYTHAGYYVCHLGLLMLTIGWYIALLKKQKKKWLLIIIIYSGHFLLGAQGVRVILMVSGPLLALESIRRIYLFYKDKMIDKKDNYTTLFILFTVMAGYLGGKLSFSVGQPLSRNIRKAPEKFFQQVIPHFMDTMVWNRLTGLERMIIVISLLAVFVFTLGIIKKGWEKKEIFFEEWTFLAFTLSVFLTMAVLTFTTVGSANRYYILIFFSMASVLTILWEKRYIFKWMILVIIIITFSGNAVRIYVPYILNEGYKENTTIQVAEYLSQQGYERAYATFEHANYMTVASNGKVQVSPVDSVETMNICKWLSSKRWYGSNVPYESKTAYIITENDIEKFQNFQKKYGEEIVHENKIGIYYIFKSDYNYSKLTE